VIMPGEPMEMSQSVDTPVGKVPMKSFVAQKGRVIYLAVYAEYPIVFDSPGAIKSSLDSGRDLMISSSNAKLISEKEVAYGKYAGREWKAAGLKFVLYSRAYLVNQRLYTLMAWMPEDEDKRLLETQSNDVVKFLDSFKLIKEPDSQPASAVSTTQHEAGAEKIVEPNDSFPSTTAWREFSSKKNGFNIQFPGEPLHEAKSLGPDNQVHTWISKGDNAVCVVVVMPTFSPPGNEKQRNFFFDLTLSWLLRGVEITKLLEKESATMRGYPGRLYKFQADTSNGYGISYLIGSRVYLLGAVIIGTREGEKEMARFFKSFTPLDGAASPKDLPSPSPLPAPPRPLPDKPETHVGRVKISGAPALLEKAAKKVEPDYPLIAKALRAEGKVTVNITISAEGKVITTEIIEGPPFLRISALRAAEKWEFKPTELSGTPVKVSGELTFEFTIK
jgi:TonB family protein